MNLIDFPIATLYYQNEKESDTSYTDFIKKSMEFNQIIDSLYNHAEFSVCKIPWLLGRAVIGSHGNYSKFIPMILYLFMHFVNP